MLGKFPFSQAFSTKYKLWIRPENCGLAKLSVRTEHKRKKKPQRPRQRKHHLKIMQFIQSYHTRKMFVIMLEWNWEWWFRDDKTTNKQTKQPRTFPSFKTRTGHFKSLIGRERRANIRVVYVIKVFANAKNKALDCHGLFELVWQTQICNL